MRHFVAILILLFATLELKSQELRCNVQVVSQKVQGTNKKVFETLQKSIYEFMNNRAWTNHVYEVEERIECNLMINITEQSGAEQFTATMTLQVRRPVFNSSYNTTLLNYKDENFDFDYIEDEPLEYNESSYTSNLTSLLAFYAYIIVGFDYDSFSSEGGTDYFQKAEAIVSNAQNSREKGWKAFESSNNHNRYWLVRSLLNEKYAPIREYYYQYHRMGLDLMATKTSDGRAQAAESLRLLQKVYREKPDPYMFLLQIVIDAKSDEWINLFSESFTDEKTQVITILKEIDPSNSSKYQKLQTSS